MESEETASLQDKDSPRSVRLCQRGTDAAACEGARKAKSPRSRLCRQSAAVCLSAAAGSFYKTDENFILSPRASRRPPPIVLHTQTFYGSVGVTL